MLCTGMCVSCLCIDTVYVEIVKRILRVWKIVNILVHARDQRVNNFRHFGNVFRYRRNRIAKWTITWLGCGWCKRCHLETVQPAGIVRARFRPSRVFKWVYIQCILYGQRIYPRCRIESWEIWMVYIACITIPHYYSVGAKFCTTSNGYNT